MRIFWEAVIEPLLEMVRPRVIVEVGMGHGLTTQKLAEFAVANDSKLYAIDPQPHSEFDPKQLAPTSRFEFHRTTSLEALDRVPGIEAVDVALIDGDHNWYTVYNELTLLAKRTADAERPFPLTLLHDVDWPYGRRDLYYEPGRIPEQHRQPYRRGGLFPGEPEPDEDHGLSLRLHHAIAEGGPRNGVRTAVEDFLNGDEGELRSFHVPGFHGLLILAPNDRLERDDRLRRFLDGLSSPAWLHAWCERIEHGRVVQFARLSEARRSLG